MGNNHMEIFANVESQSILKVPQLINELQTAKSKVEKLQGQFDSDMFQMHKVNEDLNKITSEIDLTIEKLSNGKYWK